MLLEKILKEVFDYNLALMRALGGADYVAFCRAIEDGRHCKPPQARRDKAMKGWLEIVRKDKDVQDHVKKILLMLMSCLDPCARYGTELFQVIAEYGWTPALEGAAIRRNKETGKLQIYLRRRPPNEPSYPNEQHCPGTGFQPSDALGKTPEAQLLRLAKTEQFDASSADFVGIFYNPIEERGPYISIVYLVDPEKIKEYPDARWCDLEEAYADPSLCEHHRNPVIPMAEEAFICKEQGLEIIPRAI